jgi:hypothetical protein
MFSHVHTSVHQPAHSLPIRGELLGTYLQTSFSIIIISMHAITQFATHKQLSLEQRLLTTVV